MAGRIEWCAAPPSAPADGLLVFDQAGRLDLLDPQTGRSRLDAPLSMEKGTRLIGWRAETACCSGPTTVSAVRVSAASGLDGPGVRVLWQAIGASTPAGSDPEGNARLVAAALSPAGVLVARSDGQIAELGADTGTYRWSVRVDPFELCTLSVRDDRAACGYYRSGVFHVACVSLDPPRPRVTVTKLPGPAPLWSALSPAGVVVAWGDRWAVVPARGTPRSYALPAGIRATAATVGLVELARRSDTGASGGGSVLRFLVSSGEHLVAFDPATGRLVGRSATAPRSPAAQLSADRLVIRTDAAIRSSARLWALHRPPHWKAVAWGDGEVIEAIAVPGDSAPRIAPALLLCVRLGVGGGVGESSLGVVWVGPADRTGSAAPPITGLSGAAAQPRQVIRAGKMLVVVEDRRLLAYTVPRRTW